MVLPFLAIWMRRDEKIEVPDVLEEKPELLQNTTIRDKIENGRLLNIIFFSFFLVVMIQHFRAGETLDINRVNMIFLFLAMPVA
jgi:short subunit fatty acids transporter